MMALPGLVGLVQKGLSALDVLDARMGLSDDERERGAATVEFALLMPLFLSIFFSSFEISMYSARQIMLERAVDLAVRKLRLDSSSTVTANVVRQDICARSAILPDCEANMVVEMTEVSRVTFALPAAGVPCVDLRNPIQPPDAGAADREGKLILLRACYSVTPFLPGSAVGAELVADTEDGASRMVASTAFMVEPQ